jgi:hypothetical protein
MPYVTKDIEIRKGAVKLAEGKDYTVDAQNHSIRGSFAEDVTVTFTNEYRPNRAERRNKALRTA